MESTKYAIVDGHADNDSAEHSGEFTWFMRSIWHDPDKISF